MPRIDNNKFYTSAMELHGVSAKGVNWNSSDSQDLRFKIILDLLPQNLSEFTLADAGCGFGDFYLYAKRENKLPKEYIAIDSIKEMVEITKERTQTQAILADICKDPLPFASYYICSGAMNTLELFETHLFMQNCYASCEEGFIFNILHGSKKSKTYNYLTISIIKTMASEIGVREIKFREDYMKNDITVGFFR
ncbi:MAG: class I SAM-dependent methyltransferase [Sulfurimonas sp.]|uniref:class I SAM-dependent methyltransferase n=1 Tax=Sulfurimonas sp. TaxID=2022749 RepID=UPI0025D3C45A|nr:class I SAM-dependent methyltransferase [Sulfurimonas sp.]MCK9492257.1 class I SAM-dependent methyltransferase [Sulfurimonas sp.]